LGVRDGVGVVEGVAEGVPEGTGLPVLPTVGCEVLSIQSPSVAAWAPVSAPLQPERAAKAVIDRKAPTTAA
jgi:hypothetical protein